MTTKPSEQPNILVVDDEPGIQRALLRILSRNYSADAVASGEEAIRKLVEKEYDVAIVDLRMPGMDGFQLLRTIKLYRPQTEVIIMSGSASDEKLIEAIQDQAFYFVTKPFQKEVIETLVERCVWAQRLQRQNLAYMEQLERYLEQAKEFQASLLPLQFPQIPGVTCGIRYIPSEVLGGDFYDFHSIAGRPPFGGPQRGVSAPLAEDAYVPPQGSAGRYTAMVVADVFGHGVVASMRTGIVKSLFGEAVREDPSPVSVLSAINKGMNRFGGESPLTLFYGVLCLDDMSLCYGNAGHPPALLCRRTCADPPEAPALPSAVAEVSASPLTRFCRIEKLESSAPLLGAGMELPRDLERTVHLSPGDTLVLYTDGIVEAVDSEHRWFGLENVVRTVQEHVEQPPAVIADEICRAARRFAAGGLPLDDLTAIVLRFERRAKP